MEPINITRAMLQRSKQAKLGAINLGSSPWVGKVAEALGIAQHTGHYVAIDSYVLLAAKYFVIQLAMEALVIAMGHFASGHCVTIDPFLINLCSVFFHK